MKKLTWVVWTNMAIGIMTFVMVVAQFINQTKNKPIHFMERKYAASVVKVLAAPSDYSPGGTGFVFFSPTGEKYLLTNDHVCRTAKDGQMHIASKVLREDYGIKYITVDIVERYDKSDLCLLEAPLMLPATTVTVSYDGNDKLTSLGHPMLGPLTRAEGYLLGFDTVELAWGGDLKACKGEQYRIVKRKFIFWEVELCLRKLFAGITNVPTFPGSSGSPVFDSRGLVIGIIFAGNRVTNYGDFIPSEIITEFMKEY